MVEAWADRTAELSALPGVEQVFCFENRGEEIGVTLSHPHGQIYAYPFVTPRTRTMLASAPRATGERTGGNLFADVLAAERAAGDRVVAANEHWTAFVPAAARWPYEIHLYPHRPVPDIPALSTAERDAFGPVYLEVLRRLDGTVRPDDALHRRLAPGAGTRSTATSRHLHLQLFSSRGHRASSKYLAGSESGMGVFVNDVRPEEAAQRLRDVRL